LHIYCHNFKKTQTFFSLKPRKEAALGEKSIWSIYQEALSPEVIDCNQKYELCPLTKKDMSMSSLLSGIF
jgi:hypothetical protein